MARTPDRFPGSRIEEEIVLENQALNESGSIKFVSGSFRFQENDGSIFNPKGVTVLNSGSLIASGVLELDFPGATFTPSGSTSIVIEISGSSGGDLTEQEHETLDTLVHELAEDAFTEYLYLGNTSRISNVTTYTDMSKTTKIRETQVSYTGFRPTQIVEIQYDPSGVEVQRVTDTISYLSSLGNRVNSIISVKSGTV